MIKRSEQLVSLCDACGLPIETGGKMTHFENKGEARQAEIDSGWDVFEYWIFCANCVPDKA